MRHVVAAVLVVAFCGLGYWQFSRAADGNAISWAYAVEWPVFALFTAALWVREVRTALKEERGDAPEAPPPLVSPFSPPAAESTGDADTDAYNRYLEWLAENPDRRPADYPG